MQACAACSAPLTLMSMTRSQIASSIDGELGARIDAGVGGEDVDAAVRARATCAASASTDARSVTSVSTPSAERSAAAQVGCRRLRRVRVDICEHDARARRREHRRDAEPDSARAAGDDGDLIGELLHRRSWAEDAADYTRGRDAALLRARRQVRLQRRPRADRDGRAGRALRGRVRRGVRQLFASPVGLHARGVCRGRAAQVGRDRADRRRRRRGGRRGRRDDPLGRGHDAGRRRLRQLHRRGSARVVGRRERLRGLSGAGRHRSASTSARR